MEKLTLLQELTQLNTTQAKVILSLLEDLDVSVEEYINQLLKIYSQEGYKNAFHSALRAIRKLKKSLLEKELREGSFRFESIDEMFLNLTELYDGEEVVNCVPRYYPFIVFKMKDGDFLAKYDPEGKMGGIRRLDSEETMYLLKYLFNNQERIGVVSWEEANQKLLEAKRKEQLELLQAELRTKWEGRALYSKKHQTNIWIKKLFLLGENEAKVCFTDQSGELREEVIQLKELDKFLLPPQPHLSTLPEKLISNSFNRV